MWIRYLLLVIIGLGGGGVTAAGYFAILASVGVITRFADYTNTANKIRLYEICLCLGGITGNILFVFTPKIQLWNPLTVVVGVLIGMFIGCFLLSLAEAVKGLPIFLRKGKIQKGITLIIISFAIGKTIGSLFYFCCYFLQNQV